MTSHEDMLEACHLIDELDAQYHSNPWPATDERTKRVRSILRVGELTDHSETTVQDQKLLDMFYAGFPNERIAAKLGVSTLQVRRLIEKLRRTGKLRGHQVELFRCDDYTGTLAQIAEHLNISMQILEHRKHTGRLKLVPTGMMIIQYTRQHRGEHVPAGVGVKTTTHRGVGRK